MVKDRANQEIAKQQKLGKPKLPPLDCPRSLDGVEMFGLTSPTIVEVKNFVGNVITWKCDIVAYLKPIL